MKNLNLLNSRLKYEFKNLDLLELAFTHRSYESPHNERLEFLGDSVLGLCIADILYERFPECTEGELTKMKAFLVKGETLCRLSEELKLGEFIKLGVGELKTGGRKRESILENTIEAVLGAIFLDADLNLNILKKIIEAWYEDRFDSLSTKTVSPQDAKSKLQEYLQKLGEPLPIYEILNINGREHEQVFTVICKIGIKNIEITGIGSTRKSAEQAAASEMLQNLGA